MVQSLRFTDINVVTSYIIQLFGSPFLSGHLPKNGWDGNPYWLQGVACHRINQSTPRNRGTGRDFPLPALPSFAARGTSLLLPISCWLDDLTRGRKYSPPVASWLASEWLIWIQYLSICAEDRCLKITSLQVVPLSSCSKHPRSDISE